MLLGNNFKLSYFLFSIDNFSTYTTIGFGTISANTIGCRIATVLYGACGIPVRT